jgi:putative ABC transport system permease protein
VVAVGVDLPQHRYGQPAQVANFRQTVLEQLRAIAGVDMVALASRSPVDTWWPRVIEFADSSASPPGQWRPVAAQSVSPEYFQVLGIPLRNGRLLTGADDAHAPTVAVVSESFARRFFPEGDPVGRRFHTDRAPAGEWVTVMGVVGDLKLGERSRSPEAVFLATAQEDGRSMTFLVRSVTEPAVVLRAVGQRIRGVDPELPLMGLGSLRDQLRDNMGGLRMMAGLLAVTGALALGLAVLGIYSVMAQNVAQRTAEIGLRMALGAARRDVLAMVLRSGMRLAAIGLAIGLPLALCVGWLLSNQIGGEIMIAAIEPLPLATVLVLLAGAAWVACWLPARRAAQVDPMVALRYE